MEQLKTIYCKYDMVCEAPSGGGIEIVRMPNFFVEKQDIESVYAHVHNFYEIVWFIEGNGVHYVDFKEYSVSDNTLFFIAPGQVHSFDNNHNQKGFVLKVCHDLFDGISGDDMTLMKFDLFNADSVPYHHIKNEEAEKLKNIIENIEDENYQFDKIGHKEFLKALVIMMIIIIERGSNGQENRVLNVNKTSHKTFLLFRQLLEQNYRELHTVSDYAKLLKISTKTLNNYISDCSPLSPLEIINGRIILEAKRMLRYTDLMIKEIGYKLGFEDPSYFVKFFKRETNLLPISFREQFNNATVNIPKEIDCNCCR